MDEAPISCDVLVAGSGAGGFTAALAAAAAGLEVVLVEKDAQLGGTSAFSGGVLWAPCNRELMAGNLGESRDRALTYIADQARNRFDRARAEAFVDTVQDMENFLTDVVGLHFTAPTVFSDYHPSAPGGMGGGRSLWIQPIEGRTLGTDFALVRPTYKTIMLWGGLMLDRGDIFHLTHMTKSLKSFAHAMRLILRYRWEKLRFGRGTRLTSGNALIGGMLLAARRLGIDVRPQTAFRSLLVEGARVAGAEIEHEGRSLRVTARRGVVLATGGFAHAVDKDRFYGALAGRVRHTLVADGNAGDGLHAAEAIGAAINVDQLQPAAWAPISFVPQAGGRAIPFPHFIDRAKPGVIAVDRHGKRFVNESRSYHDFVQGLFAATEGDDEAYAWLLGDHETLRKQGLGAAPPAPGNPAPYVKSGYLIRAGTVGELASRIGIDPAILTATIELFNQGASSGADLQYGRGADVFQRMGGDPTVRPNPCVAPIANGPFYAIKIYPADLGSFNGLRTDGDARVLDADGAPIAGLYAVGGDAASVFGGEYVGGGSMVGPAVAFGFRAGRHLAAEGELAE